MNLPHTTHNYTQYVNKLDRNPMNAHVIIPVLIAGNQPRRVHYTHHHYIRYILYYIKFQILCVNILNNYSTTYHGNFKYNVYIHRHTH